MKRQKICIIGGGLTGLLTAVTLSKINLEIDIISDNPKKKLIQTGLLLSHKKT